MPSTMQDRDQSRCNRSVGRPRTRPPGDHHQTLDRWADQTRLKNRPKTRSRERSAILPEPEDTSKNSLSFLETSKIRLQTLHNWHPGTEEL